MKDYYSLFIELSLQQCRKNDYQNKEKVKIHNMALKRLKQLQAEWVHNDNDVLLIMLLSHEDDRVRINAAAFCLQCGIFTEEAVITLEKIKNTSTDPTICLSARMLLHST